MCGSLKAKKQSCSKNLITMENARLMCGIWLPSAITLTCSGCSDLRRTLSRQFVFLSQDWKVFFSPCRSASLCSFPLILCTGGVSVPERRVEKTDICLTKSSGEATLSDPLPNSLRPYPFGHLPHTLPLALTVCVRACTRQREESLPTMLCISPPRSLLPQSAPSLLYFFKLLLLRSDWHRQALLWAQERVWGREGKGTVLQLSILATMPEVVVARLSVLLWMRCTDAHLNSKPPVSIAVQTDLHPGLCTCYWSL